MENKPAPETSEDFNVPIFGVLSKLNEGEEQVKWTMHKQGIQKQLPKKQKDYKKQNSSIKMKRSLVSVTSLLFLASPQALALPQVETCFKLAHQIKLMMEIKAKHKGKNKNSYLISYLLTNELKMAKV